MKRLIILAVSFLLASTVFADNKSDQIEKEIRILKQQVEALGNNRLDPIFTANAAEDKVNAFLTLSGYIEMSYGKLSSDDYGDVTYMDVGVVEFVFDFDFSDNLSASIHVTSEKSFDEDDAFGGDDDAYTSSLSGLYIEEAWLKWTFDAVEGLSLKVGIQDVNPGLESTEAVDLYQFSTAYMNEKGHLPTYIQGVTFEYDTEQFTVSFTLADGLGPIDQVGGPSAIDGNVDEFGFIIQGGFKLGENGMIHAAFGAEDADAEDDDTAEYDFWDIWATYTFGQFEVAAEFAQVELSNSGTDEEWTHVILRGTWSINDKWSVTVRYDLAEEDNADIDVDTFIISPAVVVSENLLILAEFGTRTIDSGGSSDIDEDWFAIEAFITF